MPFTVHWCNISSATDAARIESLFGSGWRQVSVGILAHVWDRLAAHALPLCALLRLLLPNWHDEGVNDAWLVLEAQVRVVAAHLNHLVFRFCLLTGALKNDL